MAPRPPSRRRPERRSYLFPRKSAPLEEAGLTDPFPVFGRHRFAEAPGALARRPFGPEPRGPVEGLLRRCAVDAALPKLFADAQRAAAAADPGIGVVLGEPFLAEDPLRFERREHLLDHACIAAARDELERELAACMLAAGEQPDRPLPELRLVLAAQAPTASPAPAFPAEPSRPDRSLSRSATSIACATSSFCLRKSRTLSRP